MKIEDIEINNKHVGKEVTYYDSNTGVSQSGVISSFNDSYVFVKYHKTNTSQATRYCDLYWGNRETEFEFKYLIIDTLESHGEITIDDFKVRNFPGSLKLNGGFIEKISIYTNCNIEIPLAIFLYKNKFKMFVNEIDIARIKRSIKIDKIL